jgi:fibronectin type 3 domain-containing protein
MAKRYLLIIALLFVGKLSVAQSAKDYSIQLSAVVQELPARITLSWDSIPYATSYQIFKKPKSSTSWGPAMAFLGATDTMYEDNAVIVDSSYEYKMVALGVQTAYGYIHAGVKAPAIHNRGALILMVDSTFSIPCMNQLTQLVKDLSGDGWEIIRHDVPRTMTDVAVKALIQADKQANTRVSAVYIVGHVAVPYSGEIAPDGHSDHNGAWPADVFYADVDGIWSDMNVNNTGASRPQNENIPGDGKWDQNFIPSATELQIGRVDFFDMPLFNKTEEQMMTSYLNRAHKFKMDSVNIVKRAVISDNFGGFGGEAFAANGWRGFPPMVGREKIYEIPGMIAAMDDSSFLFAHGCGAGSYTSAGGVGTTTSYTNFNVNGIFVQLFGSYFGDWDSQNNFLRAPLCADIPALTSCWAGRPNWYMHHMTLGENIGYSAKVTQNNSTLYTPGNFGTRYVHIALMGDPSLRTEYLAPPKNMTVVQLDDTSNFVNWDISPDTAVIGYYVYRSASKYGFFKKISPLLTNHNFADQGVVSGTYFYQVRAVKPEMTPSGGYYNLSIGALSDSIITDNTLTVAQLFKDENVTLYPNPATSKITVQVNYAGTDKATITLIDITGKKHQTINKTLVAGSNEISMDVHSLPSGMYAVLVQTKNGTITRKWMKID